MELDKYQKKTESSSYIPKVIYVFQTSILFVSIIVTILSIIFAKYISSSLFGTEDYKMGVVFVSFAILFNGIASGQKSILNGLRDLKGLAVSQIISSVVGTFVCVLAIYFFGKKGVPFYIFFLSVVSFFFTWRFTKKLKIEKIIPKKDEFVKELKALFKLGLSFSVSGVIAVTMTYLSRIYITNNFDLDTVGVYQSSWTISNLYVGMILSAMGVDLMPRLMKIIGDNKSLNTAINEQMELGVLASSIGIIGIILFSSLLLSIFYSSEFSSGQSIIRWQILGVGLRLLGFPLSYAIAAKEKVYLYIAVQALFWGTDYILLILFSEMFGFQGLGLNFFVAYIFYVLACWVICVRLFNFNPSFLLKKIMLRIYAQIVLSFLIYYLPIHENYKYILGVLMLCLNVLFVRHYLIHEMHFDLKAAFEKIKKKVSRKK